MKPIDYVQIIANLKQMINALEFDSMRSAGKAKMNTTMILDMYKLIDVYSVVDVKSAPAKKEG